MISSAYIEQAALALAVFGVCLGLVVIGAAVGIIAIARATACTADEASRALATVIRAIRPRGRRLNRARTTGSKLPAKIRPEEQLNSMNSLNPRR